MIFFRLSRDARPGADSGPGSKMCQAACEVLPFFRVQILVSSIAFARSRTFARSRRHHHRGMELKNYTSICNVLQVFATSCKHLQRHAYKCDVYKYCAFRGQTNGPWFPAFLIFFRLSRDAAYARSGVDSGPGSKMLLLAWPRLRRAYIFQCSKPIVKHCI